MKPKLQHHGIKNPRAYRAGWENGACSPFYGIKDVKSFHKESFCQEFQKVFPDCREVTSKYTGFE